MTEHERIARGLRAFDELTETKAAFDAVEAALLKTMAETPVGQDQKVLDLHKSLGCLAGVRKALQAYVDDGLVARDAIAVAGLTRPG